MNENEIIKLLLEKRILIQIGGQFFLTEKYKEIENWPNQPVLISEEKKTAIKECSKILEESTPSKPKSSWPEEILEAKDRARGTALMDACEIPRTDPANTYRLRGLNAACIKVINGLVLDKDIIGTDFIEAIKDYYATTEYPKAFKNLITEGDIIDIYSDWLTKGSLGGTSGDSSIWK